jgi:cob(I)alamin adenosyltransferase
VPIGPHSEDRQPLRITAAAVERLEQAIDRHNTDLSPLTSFILPGGSAGVAALHLSRAIVRRAERAAVALNAREPLNPHLLAYLNRLSDHLFVSARHVAAAENGDVLWQPGASRDA